MYRMPKSFNPMPHKRRKIHTTQLDFLDYFHIMNMMKSHKQKPNFTITQHDKDKLTYRDAYDILCLVEANAKGYTSKMIQLQFDIDTALCKCLVKNKALTKKQVLSIIHSNKG